MGKNICRCISVGPYIYISVYISDYISVYGPIVCEFNPLIQSVNIGIYRYISVHGTIYQYMDPPSVNSSPSSG